MLNVLDMVKGYDDIENESFDDLFEKPKDDKPKQTEVSQPVKLEKKPWRPDDELLEGMDELTAGPVVYDKKDVKLEEDTELKNVADDEAKRDAIEAMDELHRTQINIDDAKKRHGIDKFKIPEGEYHVMITAAAADTNYERAQRDLDEIFDEIERDHPEFILEWIKGREPKRNVSSSIEVEEDITVQPEEPIIDQSEPTKSVNDDLKIVIDKSKVSSVVWSDDEMDKIRKSRSIELNIVESHDIDYAQIKNAPDTVIDSLINKYHKRINDIDSPIPASRYRATFRGLSYPEVLDLSNADRMNNIDGEIHKWTIVFDHLSNQSIGDWREYKWYIDPKTLNRVELKVDDPLPFEITEDDITYVSKFDDFLMKTSFIDLNYMLWKILCATTKEKEIINISCGLLYQGKRCGYDYDWIYIPESLLDADKINPLVLEEMKRTMEVSSEKDIIDNYNESMLRLNNVVDLKSAGIKIVFGHISAYKYLHEVYPKIKAIESKYKNDPTAVSKSINYSILSVVKYILMPDGNGGWYKVEDVDRILRIINNLDEVDWQTLTELVRIMIPPYTFTFSMKDVVCPRCHNTTAIPIEDLTRLLFIVAQNLASVNVTLKRS